MNWIRKGLLLLFGVLVTVGGFLLSNDNFFVAGGSDAAEMIVRVPFAVRLVCLILALVAWVAFVFLSGRWTSVLWLSGLLVFVLSQNIVRVSGRDFTVVQSFALVPVKRWSINTEPTPEAARVSLRSTWCCLVSVQAFGERTIVRGIWPIILPEKELGGALERLVLE